MIAQLIFQGPSKTINHTRSLMNDENDTNFQRQYDVAVPIGFFHRRCTNQHKDEEHRKDILYT